MATTTATRATAPRQPVPKRGTAPVKAGQRRAGTRVPAPRKNASADQPARRPADAQAVAATGPHRPVAHAVLAAERAMRRDSTQLRLPIVGELHLPAPEEMAFIGGVAVLAVVGLLEWPVALLLGLGHGLATSGRNKVVRAFGEALEEA